MKFIVAAIATMTALPAFAQDAGQRQRAALPFVIEQRNNALDGVALCQGDLAGAQAQIGALQKQFADAGVAAADLQKKLDAANAQLEQLKRPAELPATGDGESE